MKRKKIRMDRTEQILEQLFEKQIHLYAHTPWEEGREKRNGRSGIEGRETLGEHMKRCDAYFQKMDREKQLGKIVGNFCHMMYGMGQEWAEEFVQELFHQMVICHDLGKCNPKFQENAMGNGAFTGKEWGGVLGKGHSYLSALIYMDLMMKQAQDINSNRTWKDGAEKKKWERRWKVLILEHAYVIARHHTNFESITEFLDEMVGEETETLVELANQTSGYHIFSQEESFWRERKRLKTLYLQWKKKEGRRESITNFFYMRLLYSVLVSCDYYSTSEYQNHVEMDNFGTCTNMEEYIQTYQKSSRMKEIRSYEKQSYSFNSDISRIGDMNELRSHMFLDVEKTYIEHADQLIYFLEAPTGSGKSNAALNVSFHMMKDKKKLIYIYPFNTLVDQNKKTLEELFPQKSLAEQMVVVNSLTPIYEGEGMGECDTDAYYAKVLLDRQFLNYPFLITTHVSFFTVLFGRKKTDLFGFLQLADSVAVMDEIQGYKNTIWAEMILFLRVCAELMGMKIVMMSATLPGLERLGGEDCQVTRLLPQSGVYFSHPVFCNRVHVSYELLEEGLIDMERLYDHVKRHYDGRKKILVEFIRKESAYKWYRMVCERGEMDAECVTGDDSAYERERILTPIRNHEVEGVVLVATQVVEAGVDIDMDLGYKNISKLDSEEQFMGRINRSCIREGTVYFFEMDRAASIYKNDIQLADALTLRNPVMQNILREKRFGDYYEAVLDELKQGRNDKTNGEGLERFFKDEVAILNFKAIEDRMRLIDEKEWLVTAVLCRVLEMEDGSYLDGRNVWEDYVSLLHNTKMGYAEKQVKLSRIKCLLNHYIYQVANSVTDYNDTCGELYCYYNGEDYMENGKLNREKLGGGTLFW